MGISIEYESNPLVPRSYLSTSANAAIAAVVGERGERRDPGAFDERVNGVRESASSLGSSLWRLTHATHPYADTLWSLEAAALAGASCFAIAAGLGLGAVADAMVAAVARGNNEVSMGPMRRGAIESSRSAVYSMALSIRLLATFVSSRDPLGASLEVLSSAGEAAFGSTLGSLAAAALSNMRRQPARLNDVRIVWNPRAFQGTSPACIAELGRDVLSLVADWLPLGKDAARLACVCRSFRAAVKASKWPPWSASPTFKNDAHGRCLALEPSSGRFDVVRDGAGF